MDCTTRFLVEQGGHTEYISMVGKHTSKFATTEDYDLLTGVPGVDAVV
jgi:hypothetical protein